MRSRLLHCRGRRGAYSRLSCGAGAVPERSLLALFTLVAPFSQPRKSMDDVLRLDKEEGHTAATRPTGTGDTARGRGCCYGAADRGTVHSPPVNATEVSRGNVTRLRWAALRNADASALPVTGRLVRFLHQRRKVKGQLIVLHMNGHLPVANTPTQSVSYSLRNGLGALPEGGQLDEGGPGHPHVFDAACIYVSRTSAIPGSSFFPRSWGKQLWPNEQWAP